MKKGEKKKVDSIEKLATLVADGFSEMNTRFDAMDARMDRMENDIRAIRTELADVNRRIDRLEEQGARQAGYAKEIDHLIQRVSKIEKHLRQA